MNIFIGVALVGLAVNLINVSFWCMKYIKKKKTSYIPFVGGFIGSLIILNIQPKLFWLPLALDMTVPFYIWRLFKELHHMKKMSPK